MIEQQQHSLRAQELRIDSLFGIFTFEVTVKGQVTIIHGPNGSGKTTVLRMLSGLLTKNFAVFSEVRFKEFSVLFSNMQRLIVRKRISERTETSPAPPRRVKRGGRWIARHVTTSGGTEKQPEIEYILQAPNESEKILLVEEGVTLSPDLLLHIDRGIPGPYQLMNQKYWINSDTGEHVSLQEMARMFPQPFAAVGLDPNDFALSPAPTDRSLSLFLSRFSGYLIQTRRLDNAPKRLPESYPYIESEASPDPELRVTHFSSEIALRIQTQLGTYAKNSQQLDSTFPARLINFIKDNKEPLRSEQILERLSVLETKRSTLTQIGFLDKEGGLTNLTVEDVLKAREALHIYVQDVEAKLGVFDDLEQRVSLFVEIVNRRFQHKQLSISRERGFVFTSLPAGDALPPEVLSSGEQHELIVLYELLFRAPHGGLILIDEPEISLHVGWQLRFVEDLLRILERTGCYCIIATHSPSIINGRWGLTVQLEESGGGE